MGVSDCADCPQHCTIWEFDLTADPLCRGSAFPPLICIPTTAGTGAETESTAMVTHAERG